MILANQIDSESTWEHRFSTDFWAYETKEGFSTASLSVFL